MRLFRVRQYLLVALLFTLSAAISAAQDSINEKRASYLTIQVPGSLGTYPMALNNSTVVTGYYMVSATVAHGFIQDADGAITTFSVRGSMWTEPESINTAGDITGFYEVVVDVPQGFLRRADGQVVTFDVPVDDPELYPEAMAVGINDYGVIIGNYDDPFSNSFTGFRRSKAGGFSIYAFAASASYSTILTGLNANGTIVGYLSEGLVGFFRYPDGSLGDLNLPLPVVQNSATVPEGINANGTIAGWFYICSDQCEALNAGGFVRSPQGVSTLFYLPGSIVISDDLNTLAAPHRISINAGGTVTGSYTVANRIHGFVRDPMGAITSFDPPRGMQTTATSINDSGVIAGSFYHDWNAQIAVGFLRIPML